jgi:hypothetical protein
MMDGLVGQRGLPEFVGGETARDISRETDACDTILRTLLARLGAWAEYLVLVGGLTPRYLVPEPPPGIDPHIGTTDVDLVLTLALPSGHVAPERPLASVLRDIGFEPRPEPGAPHGPAFRWVHRVDGLQVKVEFMCPAQDRPRLQIEPDPVPNTGAELGALRLVGAELVAQDFAVRRLSGRDLSGKPVEVQLRVAQILPFLVLKAYALDERQKDKDAYDVVWLLSALGDDPADVARMALASPAVGYPSVTAAISRLRAHFSMVDSRGPELYAQAFPVSDSVKRRVLQQYAFQTVKRFLKAWDQARSQ